MTRRHDYGLLGAVVIIDALALAKLDNLYRCHFGMPGCAESAFLFV